MKRIKRIGIVMAVVALVVAPGYSAGKENKRPKILRIEGVEILSSNVKDAQLFYRQVIGIDEACTWCEKNTSNALLTGSGQVIRLTPEPAKSDMPLLNRISFVVNDETEMKRWLKDHDVHFREVAAPLGVIGPYLSVIDPEGHELRFYGQSDRSLTVAKGANGEPVVLTGESRPRDSHQHIFPGHVRLIHAGFVVKNRAAMDRFYRDILGFHVYWTGGMKDGETDWVDMQVPDGTDWIEYMLNVDPKADKKELGVMNHLALGVPDVRAAAKMLEAKGMKLPEQPEIGRDGKWQLNLYDPDETRVELMEFTPVQKPCCAEYTGDHPKP